MRRFLAGLGAFLGAGPWLGSRLLADGSLPAGTNAAGIPLRVLGRTGAKVTLVGLGTAPVGHSKPGAAAGVPVYRAAIEAGINFIDTAHLYDDAEQYLGELVPQYRDRIFLVTKAAPTSADPKESARAMQRQFERSLRLMKTDHVDLLHVHGAGSHDPKMILAPGGPLEFVRQMKQQGKTRFIGVTGHHRTDRFPELLDTGEFDALMVVLNFADYHQYSFEQQVLPVARKHGCGILAMKVFGGHSGNFSGYRQRGPSKMPSEYLQRALRYSLSLPAVSCAVLGAYTESEVQQNVAWAKQFVPLSSKEIMDLRERGKALAADWGPRFGPPV